ncbi:uncharacterized protein LOC143211251, partial [Lasioglossum baleicum]|uniref:uncharacterized protein LOC143211251 n=1 Tax=Lasioglossum baleicum TaxID=434251 RepID=UPI003FCD54B6
QQPRQGGHPAGERQSRAYLRDRFSASARRNVAEKYYDCLQCAEQCHHATSNVVASNNIAINNNNTNSTNNNNVKQSQKTAKPSSNSLVPKNGTNNYRATSLNSCSTIKENTKILSRLNDTRLPKNSKISSQSKSLKNQPLLLTPVKKRSSLARPVRVHDSFSQPKKLMPMNYAFQSLQKREMNESTYEDDEQEETSLPIRLRLVQMFELTLPQTKKRRRKKSMRLMKQQQQSRHVCKDTERLLRVLSVNNVDQDNRYNVSRCSVM